jgi:hypothetical protein
MRSVVVASNNPDRSYHTTPFKSGYRYIGAPPHPKNIASDLYGVSTLHGQEQRVAKPLRLVPTDPESFAEYARLVAAAGM